METGCNVLDFTLVLLQFGGKWFFLAINPVWFGFTRETVWFGLVWDTNSAERLLCTSSCLLD